MDEKIKARPYRAKQVAWDLVPLGVSVVYCLGVYLVYASNPVHVGGLLFINFMLLPFASAIWMQVSSGGFLQSISRREFREQLALTEVNALDFLRVELRPRMRIHSVVCFASILLLAMFFVFREEEDALNLSEHVLRVGFLVYCFAMLSFLWMAGRRGLVGRLRSLCRPTASASTGNMASARWVMITIAAAPLLLFAGVTCVFFAGRLSPVKFTEKDVLFFMGVYLLISSPVFVWFFYRNLGRAWQKAADEYFRFE